MGPTNQMILKKVFNFKNEIEKIAYESDFRLGWCSKVMLNFSPNLKLAALIKKHVSHTCRHQGIVNKDQIVFLLL